MKKNFLLAVFWRYKLLLFVFFCLLIPEIDYIMFYFLSQVCSILGNKSPKQRRRTTRKRKAINDLWRENQKVVIINIFGTSRANRGARGMITNCDRTEKYFNVKFNIIMMVFFQCFLFVGHQQMNREGNELRRIECLWTRKMCESGDGKGVKLWSISFCMTKTWNDFHSRFY